MVTYKQQKRSARAQEFLTRVPLAFERQAHPSTAAWLYTALLGNGRLLACVDETGEVRQLFYPHIDVGPHLRSLFTGLQVIESADPAGLPVSPPADSICWFAEEAWEHRLEYVERTALIRVVSRHTSAGFEVERTLAVHPQHDVLLIETRVRNLRQTLRRCLYVTYAGFDFDHRSTKNCCFFSNNTSALTFFASDRYVQLTCDAPVESFDCAQLSDQNPSRLFESICHGQWSKNEYAIGQVSGAVRHDLGIIAANESVTSRLYFCFGRSLNEVAALSDLTRLKQFDTETCASWWHAHYASLEIPVNQETARRTYERSLIVLHLLTDSQTGGIIAGPECDPHFNLCGGYGMCWPRDGAYNAYALDIAGQPKQARAFYDWALHTQESDGSWSQRYDVNGRLSPTWGHQFDETGTVVWAICRHIDLTHDLSYGREVFPRLLDACSYMQRSLDSTTGLAPITKDLWEERDSVNTYACAATWGAFHEVSRLAARLEKADKSQHWARAAARIKVAIETHLWSERVGHFLRGVNLLVSPPSTKKNKLIQEIEINGTARYAQQQDTVLDTSLLGLSVPFGVFSPHDPRMRATAEAIARHLTSPIGGLLRYQQDHYRGGNPWILCTLWLAWFDVLTGNKARASELYTWVLEHRTTLDLLAEQIDSTSGQPCWIVPLGWSHAMFLLVSAALKGEM